ncbi:MAG: stage III sporulation protein AE [Clostridia bacterium]|nr:stage III sporulation protein AE [Clostridia bacterium]
MKRILTILTIGVFLFVFLIGVQTGDRAFADDLGEAVEETMDGVDSSAFDELMALLREYDQQGFFTTSRQFVEDILSGKNDFDTSYFLSMANDVFLGEAKVVLPQLAIIVVVCLIYGVLKGLTDGFIRTDVNKVVYVICYCIVLAVIANLVARSIKEATSTFILMEKISEGCFPVLVTLVAALGGSASAAVFQPSVLIFGNVLLRLLTTVVTPLFLASFVFGLIGNLSDQLKLGRLSSAIRSGTTRIVGLVFGIFSTVLVAEGITGASVDGLAVRGAKFALSSYVPVVGGYLKDGFDVVLAGCLAVKNALGLCAVIILLVSVIVPVIRLLLLSICMKLTSGILEPVTDGKFCSALTCAGDSLNILVVAVVSASFAGLLFLMTVLFVMNPGVL